MHESTHDLLLAGILLLAFLPWWCSLRGEPRAVRLLLSMIFALSVMIGISSVLALCGVLRFPYMAAALSVAAAAVAALGRKRSALPPSFGAEPVAPDVVLFNVVSGFILAAYVVLVVLKGYFVGPSSVDGRWYHIPMALILRQQESFAPVGHMIIDGYPKNFELWLHWLLTAAGGDRWLDVGQLPFLCIYLPAVYCLALSLGVRRGAALAAALTAVFAPVIWSQLLTSHNDVALHALLLAALACLYRWRERPSGISASGFACSVGLMLGMKGSALGWAFILWAVFALVARRRPRAVRTIITSTLLIAALGAYSYVLNAAERGNPFYPYAASLGPLHLPGPLSTEQALWPAAATAHMGAIERIARSWLAVGQSGYGYMIGGFGVLWPLFVAAVIASLVIAWRRTDRRRLGFYLLCAVLFLVAPLNFSPRFTLFLFAVGALGAVHVIECAPQRSLFRVVAGALLLCGVCFSAFQSLGAARHLIVKSAMGHAATCRAAADPAAYRPAFAWLQELRRGDEVVSLAGGAVYSIYCLWNRAFTNRVSFSDELKCTAREGGRTFYFIPAEKAASAAGCEPVYADTAVTIARPASAG